ncbi:MAG: glycosyltransferase [Patescibacteria group bacterium]
MFSIIIPALNEEKYLPLLLESIKKQEFFDFEIIVADAGSKDKTREIAKRYNCKIVEGGLPAKGRNNGAREAKGDILFFIDADAILQADFLNNALKEFKERNLDFASFCLIPSPYSKNSLFLLNILYNYWIIVLEKILARGSIGILIKKELFEKIGGFNESMELGEDHYLARCAQKIKNVKWGILRSVKIIVSDRRFKKDGWAKTWIKYFLYEARSFLFGPTTRKMFDYKFNHYDDGK